MLMLPVECVKQQMSVALLTLRLYVNVVFATRCASSKWPKKKKINYDSLNLSFLKFKVFSVTVFLTPAGSEHGMTKLHLVYSK